MGVKYKRKMGGKGEMKVVGGDREGVGRLPAAAVTTPLSSL